jgi:hypothetical protein
MQRMAEKNIEKVRDRTHTHTQRMCERERERERERDDLGTLVLMPVFTSPQCAQLTVPT